MFTRNVSTTDTPQRKSHRKSLTRAGGIIGAVALATGIGLAAPVTAANEQEAASYAQGRFLSGILAGEDLAQFVAFQSAEARNNGHQSTQETVDPMAATVLDGPTVGPGTDTQVDPDDSVHAGNSTDGGAVSQYARAESNGTSVGASGTVGEGGAIGPNATTDGQKGPLVFSLDRLIDQRFDSALRDLRLQIEAIAAQAKGNPDSISGDYFIDGLTLKFTSPAVGQIGSASVDALAPVNAQLNQLAGANGQLSHRIDALLRAISPALTLTGSSARVSASVSADLRATVQQLLHASYNKNGVSVNPATGEVTIDLQALAGGDLNNKPVGYEVLSDAVVASALDAITSGMTDFGRQLKDRVALALRNAQVDIDAEASSLGTGVKEVCVHADGSGSLIGGRAGGSGGAVICTPNLNAAPLATGASIRVHGTIQQILDGEAPATATARVLGRVVDLSTDHVLGELEQTLVDALFDGDGAMSALPGAIDNDVVAAARDGLLGQEGLDTLLSDLLSVKVNIQETAIGGGGGMAVAPGTRFTQTALRVAIASGAQAGGATTVNLAAATVAPRLTAAANPGDPNCTSNCTGGELPTFALGSSGAQRLAVTGIEIAALIAAILALLSAGAYLVREGRSRKNRQLIKEV